MDFFDDISVVTWLIALFGAFCLGFSKTGFPGLAMVNVLIMAELFGAKASVGIIVPLLVVCDLTVYPLFRRYSSWKELMPLMPPTFAGLVVGYFLLDHIDESTARKGIGLIVLLMFALQLVRLRFGQALARLPKS
ncbi:MAG: hypothetical protein QF920_06055, partial [Verrucomicrobiota bacterium]|nr:hypothetical protein [Verrucomicrobiota bacterium]